MKQTVFSRWSDTVLGQDRRQRLLTWRTLAALGLYLSLGAIVACGVWMGLIEAMPALSLAGVACGGGLLFFLVIRSGLSKRWSLDPYITPTQGVFGILLGCAAYVAAGPVRGAMLMAMLVGLMVWLVALPPRQSRWLAVLAVAALAPTMAWCAHEHPVQFPPQQELLHFMLAALLMPVTGWLAGQLSEVRETLRQHRLKLEESLEQNRLFATQDELTGLSNRRHMMSLIVTERARQQRNRQPISMVLLDIDLFKRINDRWGHAAGDQVLQIFADVVTHSLRAGDALARWGGEEFLLMLPETQADSALMCVERMRKQLASRSFEHIAHDLHVTFSAGISECTVGDRMELAIERADQAMYSAKIQGRNRSALA